MVTLITDVAVIPKVMDVLDEEGEVKGDGSALTKATEATAKQFEWYAGIIKKEREVILSLGLTRCSKRGRWDCVRNSEMLGAGTREPLG